jgi:hypothetical protein
MLQSIYFFRIKYFLVLIDTKLDSICFQLIEVIRQRTNQILNIVNPTESTRLAQDGAPFDHEDLRTKRGPANVATSRAIPGRRIERVDGPDRANHGLFTKKPSNFSEINPQSDLLSQFFLQKNTSKFIKTKPQSSPFNGPTFCHAGPACLPRGPRSPPTGLEWAKIGQ